MIEDGIPKSTMNDIVFVMPNLKFAYTMPKNKLLFFQYYKYLQVSFKLKNVK